MPLAIELAAATVRYQSCAQIAGQLQSSWQTLTAAYGDLPGRHRSIHAAFEHSWALLPAQEQGVFSRLSVFSQASFLFEQALVTSHELGSAVGIGESHTKLGGVAASRGYFDQAAAAYQDGARYYRQAAYQAGMATCLERLAELAWLRSQAPQAVFWLAAAKAGRQRLKQPRSPVEQQRYERRLKTMRAQLDEDTLARLWANGTATSFDDALDEALS